TIGGHGRSPTRIMAKGSAERPGHIPKANILVTRQEVPAVPAERHSRYRVQIPKQGTDGIYGIGRDTSAWAPEAGNPILGSGEDGPPVRAQGHGDQRGCVTR